MQNKKNYTLIWVLLMIVIVMSVIKLTYKPDLSQTLLPLPATIPTEIPTPTLGGPTPTIRFEQSDADYPLWRLLPYSGKGFIVDRYTAPNTLAVIAKGIDKTIIKKAVETWIGQNGIDPTTQKLIINN